MLRYILKDGSVYGEILHSYKISEEAKWFMYNFDVGNKVEPISITLKRY